MFLKINKTAYNWKMKYIKLLNTTYKITQLFGFNSSELNRFIKAKYMYLYL